MLFLIGIVAVVIMEPSLRLCGNGCLTPIIIDWNMAQEIVHVVVKVNRDIRNLENHEMVKYLKVVNLRRINYVFRSSKLLIEQKN